MLVDCYHSRCWSTWKHSVGARMDADPPGAPATAIDPAKGGRRVNRRNREFSLSIMRQ